jgi:type IV fimbrial biogenesis protein FimT
MNRSLRQHGISLVESLIVMAIAAVALGAAAPGLQQATERRHLEGAAAQLETDLMFARSLAVSGNRSLRVSFEATATGSCYVIHAGPAGACHCSNDGASVCKSGEPAVRTVFFDASASVGVHSNVRSILFDPDRGTSTPTGTIRVLGRGEAAIHKIVNIMGRVRSCAPAPGLAGYPPC